MTNPNWTNYYWYCQFLWIIKFA